MNVHYVGVFCCRGSQIKLQLVKNHRKICSFTETEQEETGDKTREYLDRLTSGNFWDSGRFDICSLVEFDKY